MICYYPTFLNDFLVQFIISRISDILLLNSSVNTYNHTIIIIVRWLINPYAFLQNQLYTFFSYSLPKSNKLCWNTRNIWLKILFSAKVLEVAVFAPVLHQIFITKITNVFEYE